MAYFTSRFKIEGIYFLDEPETALSPKSQVELLNLLESMGRSGQAQFIIASHSPILLACPGATLLNFDQSPLKKIDYEDTLHYQIYREFMADPHRYLKSN
jgi:predicted ATPase